MEIVEESNKLINNTRENKLKPDDLDGGTFTISNVGSFVIWFSFSFCSDCCWTMLFSSTKLFKFKVIDKLND